MKCQSCGHDYPSTLTRCTVCGHLTARRTRSFSDSRLIEFPRQARISSDKSQVASNVPAWRLEVSERVRQAKARRTTASPEPGAVNVMARAEAPEITPVVEQARSTRDTSPIVEAALTRVRRAQQESASLALPAIAASPVKPAATIVLDREATARALDPAVETSTPELNPLPPEKAQSEGSFATTHSAVGAAKAVARRTVVPATPITENDLPDIPGLKPFVEPIDDGPIEEIDPVDYLEAEVRKVDQSLAFELMGGDKSASLLSHIVTVITDLLTIAISSIPFIALIAWIDGSVSEKATLVGLGTIIGLLAIFYLWLTQSLCGKTFGMMFTNTRVIEDATGRHPSIQRALLRSLAYPVALAPAGIGILWVVIDPKRRAWHDLLSGTRVVRDF